MLIIVFSPLQPIHDRVAEAIAKADIAEITLLIKVLGNAGHPASLKPIMKILPGFGSAAAALPVRAQVDVILALRNIAKRDPKLVRTCNVSPPHSPMRGLSLA